MRKYHPIYFGIKLTNNLFGLVLIVGFCNNERIVFAHHHSATAVLMLLRDVLILLVMKAAVKYLRLFLQQNADGDYIQLPTLFNLTSFSTTLCLAIL